MISDVIITGYFRKQMRGNRKFRIFETRSYDALTGETKTSLIPVMHWSREEDNVLERVDNDTLAIIRGRIEMDDDIGLYVLVEMFQLNDRIIFS